MYIETEQKNHGFGRTVDLKFYQKLSRKMMGFEELWIWPKKKDKKKKNF